jgi:hypothetical protein
MESEPAVTPTPDSPDTASMPAGWFTNPENAEQLRYWDGSAWTDQVAVRAGDAPAGPLVSDSDLKWVLPVGRSGWAISAGYAGLFALIIFPAPIALILSLIAIWDLKKHPEKKGWGRTIFGLVTGVLGTVVLMLMLLGS